MPSYLITGANRGIGLGLVAKLSADKTNTVIGMVRNKKSVNQETVGDIITRENVSWVEGDLDKPQSFNAAVPEVSAITDGKLDVLIANAAYLSGWSALDPSVELAKDASRLEEDMNTNFRVNVTGQVLLFMAFLPLIRAGSQKKIVALSSGLADLDFTVKYNLFQAMPYSASKAGLNMAVAKLQAELKPEGILIFTISPGVVATGNEPKPEDGAKAMDMAGKLMAYAPHWKGPITPEESVEKMLGVIDKATIETWGGKMVSHLGNTQWL